MTTVEWWPWWMGAMGLGITAVVYAVVMGRPMGVSGMIRGALEPRRLTPEEEALLADQAALEAALLAATQAEFGAQASADAGPVGPGGELKMQGARASRGEAAVFLAGIALGAAVAAFLAGHWGSTTIHEVQVRLFGGEIPAAVAMLVGGIAVGFGTQMAGGCTSGHGLIGCARLQPGSLLATATFFGTGIALSMFLTRVMS